MSPQILNIWRRRQFALLLTFSVLGHWRSVQRISFSWRVSQALWWRRRVRRRIIMCGRRPWRSGFAVSTSGRWVKHAGDARIVGRGVKCSGETRRRVRRLRPSRAAVLVTLLQLLLETNGGRGMTFMTLTEIPFRVTRHREPQWRSLWGLRGLPVCSVQMLTRGKILSSFMKDRGYNSWWVFFREGHILYQHIWPRQNEQPLVTSQGVIRIPSCSRKLSMKSGASKHKLVKKTIKELTDRTEIYCNYEVRTKFSLLIHLLILQSA